MAITHVTAIRNGLADLVVDAIDAGSIGANGQLVFLTSGAAEVATLDFSNPAFGAAASGVATANALTDDTNATGGTTDNFEIRDRDGGVVIAGTVTATGGGGDIELSSVNVGAGDTISVSFLTYEASD